MKTKNRWFAVLTFVVFSCATPNPPEKFNEQLSTTELEQKIDQLTKQYVDLDIFSGVVLVAKKGKPFYHKAFGLANRTTGEPNTLNTKFDIGSMNKTFTKLVILQLVKEGRLGLNDPLGKFLEGFSKEAAEKVTVKHLLTHTSGFGDYHSRDFFELPRSQKTISALVKRISQMPLLFPPGEEQEYSNSGFILLGGIIEKVTGKTYHQSVKERIVEPLQLKETYVENKDEVPNRSIGYLKTMRGELEDNEGFLELPNPDGGFQSTTTDILTFYQEYFYGNQLLELSTKKELDPIYGFIEENRTTGGAIPFAGGFNGANTVIFEILRDTISVVVFANMDEPVAEQLGAGILAIIRGQSPKTPSLPAVQNVFKAYEKNGLDYVKSHFEELTINFHPSDPRDLILNQIGYNLLFQNETEKALEIFTLNTELFPYSPNVWDSLGEAWLKAGNKEKSLSAYQKALALDPEFPSAKEMVNQLSN